jgi:DNA-binding transcriptional LysR family regulator
VTIGTFNDPSAWRLDELVSAFLRRHPAVTVRLIGRNSSWSAERVRRGELEAAVVVLPIDDAGLDVRPLVRDEVLYVSAEPTHARQPITIEDLASVPLVFYDADSAEHDPIRRQLAERAQAHGVRLRPRVEVESMDLALRLVAAGVGDSYLPSAYTRVPSYPEGLSTVGFRPSLHDTFAVVTRRTGRVSPATGELLAHLESHMRAVAGELDQDR